MSELDNARAALQPFMFVVGFVDAIERFEAAVRANERSGATTAAVLGAAADALDARTCTCGCRRGAGPLRRMAIEAQQGAELSRCTCDYIAEPWISMDHAPDCPGRPREAQP